jgi:adenosylcobinamide kinase/adenosylcobinamide-phosphate guanylyltransferase
MAQLILVTGGVRSGKSNYAEQLARNLGQPVLYIATALPFDGEMQERIAHHRARRPADWDTWEAYRDLRTIFDRPDQTYPVLLVDCLTILVSNWLLERDAAGGEKWETIAPQELEQMIQAELRAFLDAAGQHGATVIMVTNEVGAGIVPENKLARLFRDIAGRINQTVAARADEVYLLVCGLPVKIK